MAMPEAAPVRLPRAPGLLARTTLRRLGPADLAAIEGHLLALCDRVSRFHACLGDDAIRAYVSRIDFARMPLVGAFDAGGTLIGLAEAHLDHPALPAVAEVSVSIAAPWRGLGLGRELVAAALELAFERGAERAELYFRPDNFALIGLARALGARVDVARGHAAIAGPKRAAA